MVSGGNRPNYYLESQVTQLCQGHKINWYLKMRLTKQEGRVKKEKRKAQEQDNEKGFRTPRTAAEIPQVWMPLVPVQLVARRFLSPPSPTPQRAFSQS